VVSNPQSTRNLHAACIYIMPRVPMCSHDCGVHVASQQAYVGDGSRTTAEAPGSAPTTQAGMAPNHCSAAIQHTPACCHRVWDR
jgi:hypothetical protein